MRAGLRDLPQMEPPPALARAVRARGRTRPARRLAWAGVARQVPGLAALALVLLLALPLAWGTLAHGPAGGAWARLLGQSPAPLPAASPITQPVDTPVPPPTPTVAPTPTAALAAITVPTPVPATATTAPTATAVPTPTATPTVPAAPTGSAPAQPPDTRPVAAASPAPAATPRPTSPPAPVVAPAAPTATPLPPTATSAPAVATAAPATATAALPTATAVPPTATPAPPAPTSTPAPSPTPTAPAAPVVAGDFGTVYNGNAAVRARLGGALQNERTVDARAQSFEHGAMEWVADGRQIYVLYDDAGAWARFADTWSADEVTTPGDPPPPGLLRPDRAFGKVWRENATVRQELGWATAAERAYPGLIQRFERGLMLRSTPAGAVYVLYEDGAWQRFAQ
jgi:hypothetical protein